MYIIILILLLLGKLTVLQKFLIIFLQLLFHRDKNKFPFTTRINMDRQYIILNFLHAENPIIYGQ